MSNFFTLELELERIMKYWFFDEISGRELWFQSDAKKKLIIDKYIIEHFHPILKNLENILNESNIEVVVEKYKLETNHLIGIIICLDQFSRHIYRYNNDNTEIVENKILNNTLLASIVSTYTIHKLQNIKIYEYYVAFLLMPFKHLDIVKYFDRIRTYIGLYINIYDSIKEDLCEKQKFLYKFYIDSLKKYVLKNQYLVESESVIKLNYYSTKEITDVCEFYSENSKKEILHKNNLVNICKTFLKNIPNNESITISLSGGPDSMVLAHIFTLLCSNKRDIKAIHINYGNREESGIEESLISKFCRNINLKLYIHRIHYFKRKYIDRSLYEKTTKKIRFNIYKLLGGNVILGHIKEDLIENIWTNFTTGRDLFKLHKIDEYSVISGVPIFRPFKLVDKKDIFQYAHNNLIPYLKNTTPKWSNRGRIRNEFLPSVHKQFGKESDDKILYLSESLVSYKNLLDKKIFDPLFNSIIYNNYGLKINIEDYLEMDTHFWQHVLTELFHKLSISMPSISSIKNFIDRLHSNKLGMINLKTNIFTYIDNQYDLYILYEYKLQEILEKIPNSKDWKIIKIII